MKKNVVILFGGCSSEYEVSLKSASAIISNMDSKKYHSILIGITRDGDWVRYYGDINRILTDSWYSHNNDCVPVMISPDRYAKKLIEFGIEGIKETTIDIVFPVLHGKNGEDGTIQGLVEMAGIPFVGCNTLSSALCMDKDRAHKLVELAGIKVPSSVVFSKSLTANEIIEQTNHLSFPVFVKPVKAGSSIGISKIYEMEELPKAVSNAFLHDNQVIVEENIEGFEVGCAIVGNDELIVGEVDEIELDHGFFDFKEKYNLKSSKIHMPARIDIETAKRIKETATMIYRVLGCQGLARVDMFLTLKKEIVFNEVNTFPGFTTHSRFPNMMKGIGLEFGELVDKLIQLGIEK